MKFICYTFFLVLLSPLPPLLIGPSRIKCPSLSIKSPLSTHYQPIIHHPLLSFHSNHGFLGVPFLFTSSNQPTNPVETSHLHLLCSQKKKKSKKKTVQLQKKTPMRRFFIVVILHFTAPKEAALKHDDSPADSTAY